jgi:hypothetical protein
MSKTIDQQLDEMTGKLDAMGTQLADLVAAQLRMEAQMAEIAKMRGEWGSDDEVTRLTDLTDFSADADTKGGAL